MIFRVSLKTTESLQPGRDNSWHISVLYCGTNLEEARIAYLASEICDVGGNYGSRARYTLIEYFASEPDEFDTTSTEELEQEFKDYPDHPRP